MPFSPILSAFVSLTAAAVFAACVLFIRSARHRAALHELLRSGARQALAVFAAATLGAALLSAVPSNATEEPTRFCRPRSKPPAQAFRK